MTVSELLRRISSEELSEWQAFTRNEPIGEDRADIRAAIISATIANANRDPKKQSKPFSPSDFLVDYEELWSSPSKDQVIESWESSEPYDDQDEPIREKPEKQSTDELLSIVEILNTAYKGVDLRQKTGETPNE